MTQPGGYFTWKNADKSKAYGIEFEGKKKLFTGLEFRTNVTLTHSKTEYDLNYTNRVSTTMYGQAPYVVNAMLAYNHEKYGISTALTYNIQGERLAATTARSRTATSIFLNMPVLRAAGTPA